MEVGLKAGLLSPGVPRGEGGVGTRSCCAVSQIASDFFSHITSAAGGMSTHPISRAIAHPEAAPPAKDVLGERAGQRPMRLGDSAQ